MAQTPEAKVKVFIDKTMKEWFPDIWRYPAPGGMFGNAGVPDRLYLYRGIFIAIEAKVEGKHPTKLQEAQLKHIARQGGIAAVIRGRDMTRMNEIRLLIESRIHDDR